MNRDIIRKCNSIYPWYGGLSGDLLFFVAIDTLWFTIVKGLTAAQVVSLTTISLIFCILIQQPILKIIHHIGNTKSIRLGTFLLMSSAILITFGPSYPWLLAGKIIYELACSFKNMESAILKNNLTMMHHNDVEFVKIRNKTSTVYSVATAIIAFIVAPMFNFSHYLPMYLCIFFAFVSFCLSFTVRDFSENYRRKHIHEGSEKLNLNKFLFIAMISYAGFCTVLVCVQTNGKLFIQEDMLTFFSVSNTASYLTLIVAVSRVMRILSNVSFSRVFVKLRDKVLVVLSFGLVLAIALLLLGFFLPLPPLEKFVLMGFGYIILLTIRDPFRTYLQGLVLSHTSKYNQQASLIYMELIRKIAAAILNITATVLLFKVTLVWVIGLTMMLSIAEFLICIKLYRIVSS